MGLGEMQALRQKFQNKIGPQPLQVAWRWSQQNLLNSRLNVLLTLLCLWVIGFAVFQSGKWILTQAQWQVVIANVRLLFVGRYPVEQLWRLWTVLMVTLGVTAFSWGGIQGWSRKLSLRVACGGLCAMAVFAMTGWSTIAWLGLMTGATLGAGWLGALGQRLPRWSSVSPGLPLLWFLGFWGTLWLIGGGLGLTPVSTNAWNGLLLTVFVALTSIVLSFPFGVLLALGRQSSLPVIRWLCIGYIELIRGVPLIGILFMALTMFPLLLPPEVSIDRLVRAIAGLTMFSAAYLSETVRGGLQSIPNGQWEAARALGFSAPFALTLIILPQALQAVVPAIVGQFIGLFKDTSLLAIVGLVELTGIARNITAQPEYLGRYTEVYLAIGLIYWLFCYGMSVASRRLEHRAGKQS